MARTHRTLSAVAIGIMMMSAPALAQSGASTSLVHTVSVTVPPRVKVQVAPVTLRSVTASETSSANAGTKGLSLHVKATRAWVLSVASRGNTTSSKGSLRWSPNSAEGFSKLSTSDVVVASGSAMDDAKASELFFQNASQSTQTVADATTSAQIVLTVSAQ